MCSNRDGHGNLEQMVGWKTHPLPIQFTLTTEGEWIVFRFATNKLDKLTRQRIKACGFLWDSTRGAYTRKLNRFGLDAANYLKKQLEED